MNNRICELLNIEKQEGISALHSSYGHPLQVSCAIGTATTIPYNKRCLK
ncbi:hypothetical protein [Paenibacillus sp. FSL K6-2862]